MSVRWDVRTCDCAFHVADDWKSEESIIFVCEHHAHAADPFVMVRQENAFASMVTSFLHDTFPPNPQDRVHNEYAENDGGLLVYIDGLPDADKPAIQASLDEHFGADEITVV